MPIVFASPATGTISTENDNIPFSVDSSFQFDLDIPIAHCKGKWCCTLHSLHSYFMHIVPYIIVFLFSLLILSSSQVSFRCHVKFRLIEMHILIQKVIWKLISVRLKAVG